MEELQKCLLFYKRISVRGSQQRQSLKMCDSIEWINLLGFIRIILLVNSVMQFTYFHSAFVVFWSLWTDGQFSPFHEIGNLWWSTGRRISVLWILDWQLSSRRTVAAEYYLLTNVGAEVASDRIEYALGSQLHTWYGYGTRHMRGPRHDIRYVWREQSISIRISFSLCINGCAAGSAVLCATTHVMIKERNYYVYHMELVDSASDTRHLATVYTIVFSLPLSLSVCVFVVYIFNP